MASDSAELSYSGQKSCPGRSPTRHNEAVLDWLIRLNLNSFGPLFKSQVRMQDVLPRTLTLKYDIKPVISPTMMFNLRTSRESGLLRDSASQPLDIYPPQSRHKTRDGTRN
jgi:hypothetical protein